MPFDLTTPKDPLAAKRAMLQNAKAATRPPSAEEAKMIVYKRPEQCEERIRLEFDDSSSMDSEIPNAKKGVTEFLRNCIPNQTACAVHFMNTRDWSTTLRSDLPQLAADVESAEIHEGDTPFFNTLKQMLEAKPVLTRAIVFTDGSPTDHLSADGSAEIDPWGSSNQDQWLRSADIIITIAKAIGGEKCIPIDTVFFGSGDFYTSRQRSLLQYLSEKTRGFFLHFDPQKMDFAKGLKYLTAKNRLALTDGNFRKAIESGERA